MSDAVGLHHLRQNLAVQIAARVPSRGIPVLAIGRQLLEPWREIGTGAEPLHKARDMTPAGAGASPASPPILRRQAVWSEAVLAGRIRPGSRCGNSNRLCSRSVQ